MLKTILIREKPVLFNNKCTSYIVDNIWRQNTIIFHIAQCYHVISLASSEAPLSGEVVSGWRCHGPRLTEPQASPSPLTFQGISSCVFFFVILPGLERASFYPARVGARVNRPCEWSVPAPRGGSGCCPAA